jgi:hypothetical protein
MLCSNFEERVWDMIYKPRIESAELKIFRSLNLRMDLSDKGASYYWKLEKGYFGELMFDEWAEGLSTNCLILNDLMLEFNSNVYQIDSLLISQGTIYLFDVKNYEGDYYIEKKRWYSFPNSEIKDPVPQLERCESLLRRYLQSLGYQFTIEPYLVFINPQFTLYQAPLNTSFIFPTQLTNFLGKMNSKISSANLNGKHTKLAQQLVAAHQITSRFSRVPDYSYEQLKKGILCAKCHRFIDDFYRKGVTLVCACGCVESIQSAVLRSVAEFKLLFPERKITTNVIREWCGGNLSNKIIRNILSKNFELIEKGRSSYYC